MDRHALEPVLHVGVVEMLGVELLDGRARRDAALAAEPAVERLQRHDAVDEHECGDRRGERIAHLPGDQVDELEKPGQAQLDPEQAERAPHEHERRGRAPGEQDRHGIGHAGQQLIGVAPRDGAERRLHPPAHRRLENAADDGAHQEDDDEALLVKPVERDGEQHGAKAVDGAERPEQQAGAVLVDARFDVHHVEDDLDDEPEHATHHEDPEQVEEVQLYVALAREIAAEHAARRRHAVLQVAQVALELAFLAQGRVDARREAGEDAELDGRADEVHADALEHDVDEYLPHGHDDERVCPAPGVSTVALDERPAKDDERDGRDECENRANGRHGEGEREVGADEHALLPHGEAVQDDAEVRPHERQCDDAVERAERSVHADDERDGLALLGGEVVGIEVVPGQVVVGIRGGRAACWVAHRCSLLAKWHKSNICS